MSCLSCASGNQAEFVTEVNIHFPGLKNVDKTSVFVFPKVLVCMDCGCSRFTISGTELALLHEVERPARNQPAKTVSNMSHPAPGSVMSSGNLNAQFG